MEKSGKLKKNPLFDQIPASKEVAIKWIEKLYQEFEAKQRLKRKGGRPATRQRRELFELRNEICRRFNTTPEEMLKKSQEMDQREKLIQREEEEEQARRQRLIDDGRSFKQRSQYRLW